jgi:transcriptional regulator with XRE-family HTH domain
MSTHDAPISKLRAERLRRGWTLTQVTQLTGIATGDLSQIEHGKRYAFRGWRERLARAFNVDEEALFESAEDRAI